MQAAASNELTGDHCSKRQEEECCIRRQSSRRLCGFSNRPRLDKEQMKRMNERNEM